MSAADRVIVRDTIIDLGSFFADIKLGFVDRNLFRSVFTHKDKAIGIQTERCCITCAVCGELHVFSRVILKKVLGSLRTGHRLAHRLTHRLMYRPIHRLTHRTVHRLIHGSIHRLYLLKALCVIRRLHCVRSEVVILLFLIGDHQDHDDDRNQRQNQKDDNKDEHAQQRIRNITVDQCLCRLSYGNIDNTGRRRGCLYRRGSHHADQHDDHRQ